MPDEDTEEERATKEGTFWGPTGPQDRDEAIERTPPDPEALERLRERLKRKFH
jgi:hypothetical protein